MKNESKPFSLTKGLTTCFTFLRVRSWDLYDRAGRSIANFVYARSRPQRIVLKATVTACVAFLFYYSWTHHLPSLWFPNGERTLDSSLPLGMLLLASFLSLLVELSGKE
jgi:hypothetical protein